MLSNAYVILRPFFRQRATPVSQDPLDAENWEFGKPTALRGPRCVLNRSCTDISTAEFPGIVKMEKGFSGPRPTPASHPHLNLEETMTSVPKVKPGDMVFWHCVRAPVSSMCAMLTPCYIAGRDSLCREGAHGQRRLGRYAFILFYSQVMMEF